MENPIIEDEQAGLNRRDVLRRGAILGGALVWTVPAVQTIAGPAFANGSPCVGQFRYFDSNNVCIRAQYLADNDCCDCVTTTAASIAAGPPAVHPSIAFLAANLLCSAPSGPCKLDLANSGTC